MVETTIAIIGVVEDLASIVSTIKSFIDTVKGNKVQCKLLAERIEVLYETIKAQYDQNKLTDKNISILTRLVVCFQQAKELIQTFSDKNWMMRIFKATSYEKQFIEIKEQMESCLNDLNLVVTGEIFKTAKDIQAAVEDQKKWNELEEGMKNLQNGVGDIKAILGELVNDKYEREKLFQEFLLAKAQDDEQNIKLDINAIEYRDTDIIYKDKLSVSYRGTFLNTPVMIKQVGDPNEKNSKRHFERELRIMRSLHHPNIIQFIGYIHRNMQYLIVTELMTSSLKKLIDEKYEFKRNEIISIALQAAKAMNYIVHHKPPIYYTPIRCAGIMINILQVNESNNVIIAKIADFGSSVINIGSTAFDRDSYFRWKAPEVVLGKEISYYERADVYSFGVFLWELVTRETPWNDCMNEPEITARWEKGEKLPLPEKETYFNEIIQSCWENPTSRPTFANVVQQLMLLNVSC